MPRADKVAGHTDTAYLAEKLISVVCTHFDADRTRFYDKSMIKHAGPLRWRRIVTYLLFHKVRPNGVPLSFTIIGNIIDRDSSEARVIYETVKGDFEAYRTDIDAIRVLYQAAIAA